MSNIENRRGGIGTIEIHGQPYDLAADLKYFVNHVKRETLEGQDAVHGYSEKPVAPSISASLRDANSMTVAAFNAMTSVTVTAILANGKSVSGDGLWCTESEEVDTAEGKFSVKFEGFQGSIVESAA
ncbi:MAG: hypothetical protein QOJ54_1893 [Aliidongia sp.]|jgi:hypothetical protein|nr:hypothetical protein [Aliidongia sp.]